MNIAMFGYKQNYIRPFLDYMEKTDPSFKCQFYGHGVRELDYIVDWADVFWQEWAHPKVLAALLRKIPPDVKMVVRANGMDVAGALECGIDWKRVDVIIVPSPTVHLAIQTSLVGLNSVQIPHPIDTDLFISLPDHKFEKRVLYHGRINKHEGVAEIIKKFGGTSWKLTVAGLRGRDSPNEYSASVLRLARNYDNVEVLDWTDDPKEEASRVQQFDIVLSGNPGFQKLNVSVLEGMSAGCYPVILDTAYTRILFPPRYLVEDVVKGANAWVKHNVGTKRSLANEAREFVESNFAVSIVAAQILEALGE